MIYKLDEKQQLLTFFYRLRWLFNLIVYKQPLIIKFGGSYE